jgi:hypothetical protein
MKRILISNNKEVKKPPHIKKYQEDLLQDTLFDEDDFLQDTFFDADKDTEKGIGKILTQKKLNIMMNSTMKIEKPKEKNSRLQTLQEERRKLEVKMKELNTDQQLYRKRTNILNCLLIRPNLVPEGYNGWDDYLLDTNFNIDKEVFEKTFENLREWNKRIKKEEIAEDLNFLKQSIPSNYDPEYLYLEDINKALCNIPWGGGSCATWKYVKKRKKSKNFYDNFDGIGPSPFYEDAIKGRTTEWKEMLTNKKFQSTLNSLQPKALTYEGPLYRIEFKERFKEGTVNFQNRSFTADKYFVNVNDNHFSSFFLDDEARELWEKGALPVVYWGKGFKGLYISNFSHRADKQYEYLVTAKCKILNV